MAANQHTLTRSQYLIWAGQMLSPDVPLYNMPFRFDFKHAIDPDRFSSSFEKLVEECEIMRTTFHFDDDNLPFQKINEDHDVQHAFLDWSSHDNAKDELEALIHEKNERQFDLEEVLYESFVIKVSHDHYVWYLNQHHLITDAWGISVQYERLAQFYAGESGEPLPQFRTYIDHEMHASLRKGFKKAREHWDEVLQKAPPLASLYNYNESRQSSETTRYTLDLDQERIARLQEIIKEPDLQSFTSNISLLSVFLTALFGFMHRVSGQRELAIGTPAHNRTSSDFQRTPGPFIEFFPILTTIDEDETLGSLYQKVRRSVMSFLMNARSGMATPALSSAFNVVLNYIHAGFPDFNGHPTSSEWLHIGHCDPRHDIRMHVIDYKSDGRLKIMLDLNHKVFPKAQVNDALGHLTAMIEAFISDRTQKLSVISMVSAEEEEALEQKLRGVARNPDDLIVKLNQWCHSGNSKPAVIQGGKALSYADLDERSKRVASSLMDAAEPGQRIGLYLERSFDYLASVIACLRHGFTFIPLAKSLPTERVKYLTDDADVAVILTDEPLEERENIKIVNLDNLGDPLENGPSRNANVPAYVMYTSGSTGQPKGVVVDYNSLGHYVDWCLQSYTMDQPANMPLFTSIGFDLTITSCLLPLCSGGSVHIYPEPKEGPDLSVLEVFKNEGLNIIKLTPSHMTMVKDMAPLEEIHTLIVGGEDFRLELARYYSDLYDGRLKMINEYGPTEATVGCVTHHYRGTESGIGSVPIGRPIQNAQLRIVNEELLDQPTMVDGELLIGGPVLARSYWNDDEKTAEKFVEIKGERYYRSGDLAFMDHSGIVHFKGRIDQQLKVAGRRVEPAEISETAALLEGISSGVVVSVPQKKSSDDVINCVTCGLPSNFPGVKFNEENECGLCTNYASYAERVKDYFRTMDDLKKVFEANPKPADAPYDCMMLLSGGKDSTYALAKLADLGLNVLAFTLDNGYISQEALDNAQRVCRSLGVDHIFGRTEAMNDIFVDSLHRHHNVCNGCFKTIYTLATNIALEKNIPIIVTGLSRGQFFETRLTEELFWDDSISANDIDDIILNARKAYHKVDDAVTRLLDVSCFDDDSTFEKVKFVDFYRYTDVELSELMMYLKKKLPWVRPSDTGRSTNCLINQLGIFVHKKTEGYSNYAFPYSWDVRIGHKSREESLDEINEEIDEEAVYRMMKEIGFEEAPQAGEDYLTLFYTAEKTLSPQNIKLHLEKHLPDYMIPWSYVRVDEIPLTANGKVDNEALIRNFQPGETRTAPYVEPETDLQRLLVNIWKEVLLIEQIGIQDRFLELGGNSLMAIRIQSRINKKLRLQLTLNSIFKYPTIEEYAGHIEELIRTLMNQN